MKIGSTNHKQNIHDNYWFEDNALLLTVKTGYSAWYSRKVYVWVVRKCQIEKGWIIKPGRLTDVMSGTSLDGVDVVLATINEHRAVQLVSLSWPIPVSLRQTALDICQGQ